MVRFTDNNVVMAILMAQGTPESIAAEYGVSVNTVRLYKTLQARKARDAADEMRARGDEPVLWKQNPVIRFTDAQVAEIRASKDSSAKLAKRFGCAPSTIRMMRTGKTYG